MSYQVIARKWRPKSFSELVGQTHISKTLLNALKNNRLPHALLFTGPRGTGKTSSARILAKALRCTKINNFTPCDECDECHEISTGSSVNVIEIDGASNNGVDAIRELRESVSYMPSSGKHKIYIIDEVHMLSTSAFNALLKTLEEPPEHVLFILATTEVQKIPNTILSRCQRFDFRRIPFKLICERLQIICNDEGVTTDEEALWVIARQGDGSMRDSQSLLDQVITFCDKNITLEKITDVLGLTDRALLFNTIEAFALRDSKKIIDIIESIFTSGYDPKVFVQDLLEELRHFLLVKLDSDKAESIIDLPNAEIKRLKTLAETLTQEDIHLLFDMALKGGHDIPKSQDPRIVLEMLLLRMSQAPRIENLLENGRTEVKKKSTPGPMPHKAAQQKPAAPKKTAPPLAAPIKNTLPKEVETKVIQPPAPQALKPEIPTGTDEQKWKGLVSKIKAVNGLVGAQLENTYLESLKDKVIKISVPPRVTFLYEKLKDPSFQQKLTNYINTFWGTGFSFEILLGEQKKSQQLTPKAIAAQEVLEQKDDIRKQVEGHPLIVAAQKAFKGQIKSIQEIKK